MIVITDISALEVWNALDIADAKVSRVRRPKGKPRPETDSELGFIHALRLSSPVHLLVPNDKSRRDCEDTIQHICNAYLPDRSLYDMLDGVLVASPELAYTQMLGRLDKVQAQTLAMELCGSYTTIGTQTPLGFIQRKPITTLSLIESYARRRYSASYAARLLRPLKPCSNDSASPMETIVELLLCGPYSQGGYGIPAPEMNARIPLAKDARAWAGKSHYSCDLLWPNEGIAIEYDSNMFHSQNHQITKDAIRRNMLEHLGIRVITLTAGQVKNPMAFESVARQLAKVLGKRIRLPKDHLKLMHALRRELFNPMPWQL